ncbi:RNA methyltransferase [Flavobacteriaceae bacterium]|nr:RNA methyltransferase [Flavobacteriaceae bacterium]
MVSKNQRKQILQLKQKKYRLATGLFVAEGEKVVEELLSASWTCVSLFSIAPHFHPQSELVTVSEMKGITHFKSPSPVLGVFKLPLSKKIIEENITIAVDGISDPGNLGTIIRLCDWFGLSQLLCSKTSVDCFNPKVIQASMGSIVRVQCHYVEDLSEKLIELNKPIYGADLDGSSLYETNFETKASVVFGNESHGLSESVEQLLNHKVSIPNFKSGRGAESLNVALAGAIFLSEIFRAR